MPRPTVLSPNSADEYIAIRNFMVAEGGLGLGNAASRVYALIYQFSIDNAGCFYGSLNYLAARTGIGRRSAVRALKELVDDGLVKEVGYYRRGDNQNTKKYVADVEKADAARRAFADYWIEQERESGDPIAPGACELPDGEPGLEGFSTNDDDPEHVENPSSGAILAPEESRTDVENPASSAILAPGGAILALDQVPFWHPNNQSEDSLLEPTNQQGTRVGAGTPEARQDAGRSAGSEEDEAFDRIVEAAVNRNLIAKSRPAFDALVAKGVKPSEIERAWAARQAQAAGFEARHHPQLKRWLEDPSPAGALRSIEASRAGGRTRKAKKPVSRAWRMQMLAAKDREFARMLERAHKADYDAKNSGFPPEERDAMWLEVRNYFDEHEKRGE